MVAAGSTTLGVNTGVSAVRTLRSSRPDDMSGEEYERITMETLENVKFGEINNEQAAAPDLCPLHLLSNSASDSERGRKGSISMWTEGSCVSSCCTSQ